MRRERSCEGAGIDTPREGEAIWANYKVEFVNRSSATVRTVSAVLTFKKYSPSWSTPLPSPLFTALNLISGFIIPCHRRHGRLYRKRYGFCLSVQYGNKELHNQRRHKEQTSHTGKKRESVCVLRGEVSASSSTRNSSNACPPDIRKNSYVDSDPSGPCRIRYVLFFSGDNRAPVVLSHAISCR